jgi:hypothetical protein
MYLCLQRVRLFDQLTIFLKTYRHDEHGDLTGKIEADFMGGNGDNGNGTFRVRHAYMSLGKWLAGVRVVPVPIAPLKSTVSGDVSVFTKGEVV